jgi:hypothetical protein
MTTPNDVKKASALRAARERYQVVRTASRRRLGLDARGFDERARVLAYEMADGEEVTPHHWVSAAYELATGTSGARMTHRRSA